MAFPGDQYQQDNASVLVQEGQKRHAPNLALMAMMCLGWGENNMRADGCNSSNHCGLFQLSSTLQAEHDYHDVRYWAGRAYDTGFWSHGGLISLARSNPTASPGYLTNLCQGAYSDLAQGAAYYDRYVTLANETLGFFHAVGGSPTPGGSAPGGIGGLTVGQLLARFNPSTIIRHDFYQLGTYGRRGFGHANGIRQLAQRTGYVTTRGPRGR